MRVLRDNRLVGRLPFVVSRRFNMTEIKMPMLTHYLGPAVDSGIGSEPTRTLNHLMISKELIAQLPRASHVYISHHRGATNTVAFQSAGFRAEVQFTFELEPAPADALWAGMRDKTRNVIRRAEDRFAVAELDDPAEFTNLYEANLRARRLSTYQDLAVCRALISECRARGAGRVIAARDRGGSIKAAVFTIWDDDSAYYFMSTRASDAGNGAVSLLVWESIKHAAARDLRFDFDIFTGMNGAIFYSGFGGRMRSRTVSYFNSETYRVLNRLSEKLSRP